jgi:ribonucleoside-triphosphate reductase
LADKGQCNLVEVNIARFLDDDRAMHEATRIMARANYRQTLVNLKDGVLQSAWHENNEFLRLCGVGLTGIVSRPDMDGYAFRQLRNTAVAGAYSMADELGLERPKNTTCVKPSGSLSKVMDCPEGAHKPMGRYIFNNVAFSKYDPIVDRLKDAGYRVFDHPTDPTGRLVTLPVSWFDKHWDSYVGVSFLFRNDPTKTAEDLGFAYLPQNVVTREDYESYVKTLKPVDLDGEVDSEVFDIDSGPECSSGGCPVK